jgi:endoglucanase
MKNIIKLPVIIVLITTICLLMAACINGDDDGKDSKGSATVTKVTVSPSTATVAKGGGKTFTATVTGTNNPAKTVTWSIVETGKHSGTSIDDGELTISALETLTTLTVRATSTVDTSKYGEATVTIDSSITVTVSSVKVSPATANVIKGDTQQFSATVTGTNNPGHGVTWTIDESGKNAGTTITTQGRLTVAAAESLSTLTVRATSEVDETKSGTATVTVIAPSDPNPPTTPQEFNDITAAELVAGMTIGWNLGNTLDCYGDYLKGTTVNNMETTWGNPRTTQLNITTLKNAGFNTIRIPVSWSKASSGSPNYTIRPEWMTRVVEVVNYAVANDMYIILNTHHDEDIFKFEDADKTASIDAFTKIWTQIADTFKNYNEKLIFEGLNEPRTKDSTGEWSGGTAPERANINDHYTAFIGVVRNSGGNNDKRILMVNPYGASSLQAAIDGLVIPDDTVTNKIIVSIHSYNPYNFALNTNATYNTWSSTNATDVSDLKGPIDRAYNKFVTNGIPVVIGEFGAMNKNNEATRANWAEYYISYAKEKGIPCVWWDNGVTTGSGELFGLLNRNNNTWIYNTLLAAMINAAGVTTTPPDGGEEGEGTAAAWDNYDGYADDLGSTITVTLTNSTSNEYTIAGTITTSGEGDVYANAQFIPASATLTAMQTMKSFSFMVSGDGNSYDVMVPTTESSVAYNHYRYQFTASAAAAKVTVNVPANLSQANWGGAGVVEFVQDNIQGIQFQRVGSGSFNLKVWDVRTYQ